MVINHCLLFFHDYVLTLCKAPQNNPLYKENYLITSILNGSGEKINMLPMNANLNRGAWKQMENTWAKALQDGKTVKVKIEPLFEGTNIRPDKFKVKYSIDNGRSIEKVLINAPGGI